MFGTPVALSLGGVAVVAGIAVLAVVVAVSLTLSGRAQKRRRARWRHSPGWGATGLPEGGVPETPPEHLNPEELAARRKDAAAALIAADEALRSANQEIDFALAAYGEEAVEPFRASLAQAQEDVSASFQRQQLLDDENPDSPQEQKAWLDEILERCHHVMDTLQERAEEFSALRDVEHHAPERIQDSSVALHDLVRRLETGRANLEGLEDTYTQAARDRVDRVVQRAANRLEELSEAVQRANSALNSGDQPTAAVAIHEAETAQTDSTALVERVENVRERLEKAQTDLPSALDSAERDIDAARALVDSGRSVLKGPANRLDRAVNQARDALEAGNVDPIGLLDQVSTAHDALAEPLGEVQSDVERRTRAQDRLDDIANRASARIEAVQDYVRAHRARVGSTTRTRLSEAQRFLNQALDARTDDPVTAARHAERSLQLAEAAARDAETETDPQQQEHWNHTMNPWAGPGFPGWGYPGSRSGGFGMRYRKNPWDHRGPNLLS